MNSYLLRNLSGITSASIEKYLLFTGWVRDDTFNSRRICCIILRKELRQCDSASVTNRIYRWQGWLIISFEDIADRCLRQAGFLR